MKNAKRIYNFLLLLYPKNYRKEFGSEMMQTFTDHYKDIQESEGEVGIGFWLFTFFDELRNISYQQAFSFLKIMQLNIWTLTLTAVLSVPMYFIFALSFVDIAIKLPHPHVSGLGALLAVLILLAVLPISFSITASFIISRSVIRVFSNKHL